MELQGNVCLHIHTDCQIWGFCRQCNTYSSVFGKNALESHKSLKSHRVILSFLCHVVVLSYLELCYIHKEFLPRLQTEKRDEFITEKERKKKKNPWSVLWNMHSIYWVNHIRADKTSSLGKNKYRLRNSWSLSFHHLSWRDSCKRHL